jgi:prolyl oligopeptidase
MPRSRRAPFRALMLLAGSTFAFMPALVAAEGVESAASPVAAPDVPVATPASAGGGGGVAAGRVNPDIAYPLTRREDVVETQFGVPVADPYRWLEGDVRTTPEVAQWVETQNATTNAYLATLPGRAAFATRMAQLYRYDRLGLPQKRGDHYFFTRNNGQQNQSVLTVRDGLHGEGRVLIDPNSWAADGATALAEWEPSPDGSRLVYTVQDGGTDWRIVRVIDVATGEQLSDELRWVKFSGLAWAHDGSGFYYSRFPEPEGGIFQTTNANQALYFHRIGTPQSDDVLVYATPDHPDYGHSAEVTLLSRRRQFAGGDGRFAGTASGAAQS